MMHYTNSSYNHQDIEIYLSSTVFERDVVHQQSNIQPDESKYPNDYWCYRCNVSSHVAHIVIVITVQRYYKSRK